MFLDCFRAMARANASWGTYCAALYCTVDIAQEEGRWLATATATVTLTEKNEDLIAPSYINIGLSLQKHCLFCPVSHTRY